MCSGVTLLISTAHSVGESLIETASVGGGLSLFVALDEARGNLSVGERLQIGRSEGFFSFSGGREEHTSDFFLHFSSLCTFSPSVIYSHPSSSLASKTLIFRHFYPHPRRLFASLSLALCVYGVVTTTHTMTETYSLLSASIKANSDNRDSLVSLEKRIARHYNNGTISTLLGI